MIDQNSAFNELLTMARVSKTKPRQRVFKALKSAGPLTMNQLLELVNDVDRVSVYRTVSLFEKLSIVQRINIGNKYQLELTDKFAEHHHHLSCRSCGKIIEINETTLESYIQKIAGQYGFSAQDHQVEIQGLCQACS